MEQQSLLSSFFYKVNQSEKCQFYCKQIVKENLIIELQMIKEQNYTTDKTFSIQKQAKKGPIHTFYNYRMTQLKSQVTFYEGQLDPLHQDNASLRDHLSNLSRLISNSTDILRKLLPTADNPNKKLKMDLANIEEIAAMIDQDWKDMENVLKSRNITINELQSQIDALTNKFKLELDQKQQQFDNLQFIKNQTEKHLQQKINQLSNNIKFVECSSNKRIEQLKTTIQQKEQRIQQLIKNNQLQKYQSLKKYDAYEKRIRQYKQQIDSKYKQIQDAKATVRAICDKLMVDKLAEQAEVYEYMLKTKEQQKMAIALSKQQIQELLKKTISVKDGEYKKLCQINQQYKLQISHLNDKIYDTAQKLMEEKKNNKQLQQEIVKTKETNKSLLKKLQISQNQYLSEIQSLKQANANQQLQIKKIKEDNNVNLAKIQQQKEQMKRIISQKQAILSEMRKNQQQGEKKWQEKLQTLKQSIKQKQNNLKNILDIKNKEIQAANERISALKYEHEKDIMEIKMKNQGLVQQMQRKFKKQTQQLKKQHQTTLRRLEQIKQQEILRVKYEFDKKINTIKQQHDNQILRINCQFTKKFEEQTIVFQKQRNQFNNHILQLKANESLIKQKLMKAQKKILEHQHQMQEIFAQNYKKIKRMQEQNEAQKRQLNERIQQQLVDFQRQLQQQINQMCNMKAKMQNEINSLKQAKGVTVIEQKCSNELNSLKLKFTQDMRKMAEQFQKKNHLMIQNYQKAIKLRQQQAEKNIRLIEINNKQKIEAIKRANRKDFISIIEQVENKSTYLNDRCLFGIQGTDLMTVENEVLIKYLMQGIDNYKQQIQKRNDTIAELQQNMLKKMRQIELYQKQIQEKVRHKKEEYQIFKRQLQNRMNEVQRCCKMELNKASKQKIQYTQKLFQQFQQIKETHQNRYLKLTKKYSELEKLFEQRPSRSEDVTKIKQLIILQQQMDFKMQSYQKKVETANSIVKYLNLQLENYKETFDIFGPNPNQNSPSISPSKTIGFSQQINDLESPKINKYNKMQKIRQQYRSLIKQASITYKQKQSQSPLIRQLKIFGDPDLNESFTLEKQQSEQKRQRKLSFVSDLNGLRKQKIRTQKTQDLIKGGQIIAYTQSFMKSIKNTEKQGYITLHEVQKGDNSAQKKKTYRRRKLSKRVTTQGVQHYF